LGIKLDQIDEAEDEYIEAENNENKAIATILD